MNSRHEVKIVRESSSKMKIQIKTKETNNIRKKNNSIKPISFKVKQNRIIYLVTLSVLNFDKEAQNIENTLRAKKVTEFLG